MEVCLRHIDSVDSVPFCTINDINGDYEISLRKVITFIENSGGVHTPNGNDEPFNSYQIVLDECSAYVEILVGKDE